MIVNAPGWPQDIWLGAVGGVPVHERTRIAQECVVGDPWPTLYAFPWLVGPKEPSFHF